MRSILSVIRFTVKLLIRDKVFLPAAIIGLLVLVIAGMASGWTVENYEKVLYDIGLAGFHFTGAVVALLWGAKIVGDFRTEGWIELELSAPMSRTLWFVGKYFGLFVVLFTLAAILLLAWQFVLYYFDFQTFRYTYAVAFLLFVIEWCVIAAVAFFFSSFSSSTTSLFCTLTLWILGLLVEPIYYATRGSKPGILMDIIATLSRFWNLQKFNISNVTINGQLPDATYIYYSIIYGVSMIGIWLLLGSMIFSRRQLQ